MRLHIDLDHGRHLISRDKPKATSFRMELRAHCKAQHDRVEQAFDVLGLDTAAGLQSTLRAHGKAIRRLSSSLAPFPAFKQEIDRLGELALHSLNAAGGRDERPFDPATEEQLHPLASAYVILGSRLGARILSKQLEQVSPPTEQAATAYFTDTGSTLHWKELTRQLDAELDEAEQRAIMQGAVRAFSIFQEEASADAPAIEAGTLR